MDTVSHDQSEKRDFLRMRVDNPAEVVIRGEGKRLKGICRDLSGSGMLVEVGRSAGAALQPGLELEVTLASPYGDAPMLKARTRVARITRNRLGRFVLGLEMAEILD